MSAVATTASQLEEKSTGRTRANELRWMLLLTAFTLFVGSIIAGVIVPKHLEIPHPDPSWNEVGQILRSNLTILAVIASCAALQRFARQEVEEGSKPWIRWICDLVVVVFITMNVATVGFAIGQLGWEGLIRILPHAPLEVPAFAFAVWGYLLARSTVMAGKDAARIFGGALLLLLAAAPIEVFISGGLV